MHNKVHLKSFDEHKELDIYRPNVDIGIGPICRKGDDDFEDEYDEMVETIRKLITKWIRIFQKHCKKYRWVTKPLRPLKYTEFKNKNSERKNKCFLAIELERKNSRKHFMGSIINAGGAGRIGLLLAWDEKALDIAIRVKQYLYHLGTKRGKTINVNNVIVLLKEEFTNSIK